LAICSDWEDFTADRLAGDIQDAINNQMVLEQPEQEPVANNPDPYHLSRILHELAGSASMCWEHVDRAGVFQSTQAADVVAAAIAEIRQRMKDAPPRREPEQEPVAWFNGKPVYHVPPRCSNCASLHAVNAELLEALKLALPQLIGHAERTARAVIAKAEGKV
jgi:hypothetical protein